MNKDNYYIDYKDMFNIYNLITKINPDYRLVFSTKYKYFAILNTAKNNQICLKFTNFSLNIISKLQKSRIERQKIVFKELDDFNNDLTNKKTQFCRDLIIDNFKENKYLSSRLKL